MCAPIGCVKQLEYALNIKTMTLEVFNYKQKMIVKFNYILQTVALLLLFYPLRDTKYVLLFLAEHNSLMPFYYIQDVYYKN